MSTRCDLGCVSLKPCLPTWSKLRVAWWREAQGPETWSLDSYGLHEALRVVRSPAQGRGQPVTLLFEHIRCTVGLTSFRPDACHLR